MQQSVLHCKRPRASIGALRCLHSDQGRPLHATQAVAQTLALCRPYASSARNTDHAQAVAHPQRATPSRPAPQGLKWRITWSPSDTGAAPRGDVIAARRVAAVPSQDGVVAAVGAGAVLGARREGDAGSAVAALLLPLLQRAPLPGVRLARGNGRPAAPAYGTGRCPPRAYWLFRLPLTRDLPRHWLAAAAGGGHSGALG